MSRKACRIARFLGLMVGAVFLAMAAFMELVMERNGH